MCSVLLVVDMTCEANVVDVTSVAMGPGAGGGGDISPGGESIADAGEGVVGSGEWVGSRGWGMGVAGGDRISVASSMYSKDTTSKSLLSFCVLLSIR